MHYHGLGDDINIEEIRQRNENVKESYFRDEADRLSLIRRMLADLRSEYEILEEVLRGVFGLEYRIDELAIMSPTKEQLWSLMRDLVAVEGYEIFNRADDIVEVSPLPAAYVVEYYFVRTPFPYRLEVMHTMNGFSPLHETYERRGHSALALNVHASFKVPTLEAYTEAQIALRKAGFECAQKCESSYGRFSYFMNDDQMPRWYLKPRINLRDVDKDMGL